MARVPIPTAVVELAEFVREHAPADDIVQDSALDPYVVLSALTERNAFVIRYWSTGSFQREEIAARANLVRSLLEIPDGRGLEEAARTYRIRWMMLRPRDVVSWPSSVLDRPAFSSAGYRLYQLY